MFKAVQLILSQTEKSLTFFSLSFHFCLVKPDGTVETVLCWCCQMHWIHKIELHIWIYSIPFPHPYKQHSLLFPRHLQCMLRLYQTTFHSPSRWCCLYMATTLSSPSPSHLPVLKPIVIFSLCFKMCCSFLITQCLSCIYIKNIVNLKG